MKKVNFTQAGGFPLEEKTLDNMQTAYFDILKTIIGHFGLAYVGNFIIYGCEVVADTIQPGMMYIDGDLCFFAGSNGNLTTKIKKIETIEDAPFESGNNLPTYFDYSALVNSGGVVLSDFVRLPKVNELVNQLINWADIQNVPAAIVIDADYATTLQTIQNDLKELKKQNAVFQSGGGMLFWNKPANQIPVGWHEVVDWRGRMPVGMDITVDGTGAFVNPEFSPLTTGEGNPGRTGGSKSKTLVLTEIPPHSHEVAVFANGSASGNADGHPDNYIDWNRKINSFNAGGLPDGTTKAFSLLNPFRTVVFIEYTGV